jgi:hypothetical protein
MLFFVADTAKFCNELKMDSPIQSSETTIDHIGLVGRSITPMVSAYRALGFNVSDPVPLVQPNPDGNPTPLGQVSAHIIFPDTYIELTAILNPGQGNHLDNWLARHDGLHILAFRSMDAEQAWHDLEAYGVVVPPIRAASREVRMGGKHGTADFKWFQIPESIVAEGFACVVQHLTPELVFIDSMTNHANGALGLRGVGVVANDLDAAFARYERLPGAERRSFAIGRAIVFKNQRMTVMQPKGFRALFPGATPPEPPAIAYHAVTVHDIGATKACLARAGVPFQPWGTDGIWVSPELACGSTLVFVDKKVEA